ncbi:MAG TPA: hypothetical protein VFT29_09405 [Gemmatimonadaceae bacterium]|nr:hypothetical protein [Gemmatimonadaceae bacterium]
MALAAMLVVACGRERGGKSRAAVGGSAQVVATPPAQAVNTSQACPATGLWSECAVFQRLDRAGLAPRRDSATVSEPPLTPPGLLLRVGNSELELYIYPDAGTREREEARLDRAKYVDYAAPLSMQPLPTLIHSANLIAILHSRNDHQRERVADAITAGPPQP